MFVHVLKQRRDSFYIVLDERANNKFFSHINLHINPMGNLFTSIGNNSTTFRLLLLL